MDLYAELRRHLDTMPVAFPESESKIELDILRRFFSEEEAEIALQLGMLPVSAERIFRRLIHYRRREGKTASSFRTREELSLPGLRAVLVNLADKKVINTLRVKKRGKEVNLYGKLPFAVGLYEFQVDRLTRDFEVEAEQYMDESFMESFAREKPRQMRTIPINETILPDRNVSSYDKINDIIRNAKGPFALQNCVCRQGSELLGRECRQTELKDTCLALGPAARSVLSEGRGRALSREEVLQFLSRAEQEGLVLQSQNSRKPVFICCCCSCCCAILSRVKHLPEPGLILGSNYVALVDESRCIACARCLSRCPVEAIEIIPVERAGSGTKSSASPQIAHIKPERCIGCGLCFSSCPTNALALVARSRSKDPPVSAMDMYIRMFIRRFGVLKGGFLLLKAGLGFKV